MANRRLNQFRFSHEPAIVDIYARISIGASGAPTIVALNNRGISTVTRVSAGIYDILLQDSYARLMGVQRSNIVSSGVSASPGTTIVSETVATLASPVIRIKCDAAGTATDPASGEIMLLQITCKNSSA